MKHFTRVLWFLSALAFFAAGCQSEDAVGALEVTSYDIPADMVLLQPVDGKVVTVHYRNGDGRTARVVVEPGSGIYAAGSQIVKLAPGAQDGQFEITLKGTSFVNDVSLPVTLTVEGQDPVNFNIELNISGEVILDAPNSSATGHYYIGAALTSDNALRLAYLAGRSRDVNIQVASPVGLTGQADATLEYMDGVVEIPLAGTLTNPSSIAQPEGNDPAVTGIYYVPCTVTVTWTGTDATRTTTVLVPVTADPYADNIGIVMRRVDVLGLPYSDQQMLTASAGLSVVYDNGYGRTVDVTVSSDQMESGPVKLQGVVLAPGKPQGAIPVSLKGVKFKEQTGQTTHVPLTVAIKDQHSGAQLSQTVSVDVSGMPVPEIGNIELVGTLKIREAANPETTFLRVYYTYGMDRVLVKAKVVSDWGVNGSALVTLNGTYFDIPLSGTPTLVDLQTMTLTIDYDAFRQPITEEVQVNISSIPDPVINTTKTALTGNALKTYVAVTGTSLRVYYTEGWGRTGVSATVTTTWGVSGSINNLTLASGSGDNNKYFDIPLRGTPTKPGTALPVTITVQFEPNLDPLEETRVTVPVTASFTPLGISTPTTSLTLTEVGDASAQVITLNYDPGEGRALKAINIVTDVPTTNNKTVYPDPAVGARRTTVGKSLTYSENLAQGSGSFSIPLEGAPKGWSSGTDYTMNIEVTYYEPGLARDLTIQLENPIPVTVALGAKRGFEPETLQYGIANDPGSTGGAQGSYVITNNVFAYNTVWVDANGDGGVDEGEVWLDRNIGATTATPPAYGATTVGYDPSYGALTQWGMPYIHLKFWDSANSRYRWLGSDNAYNANRFGLSVMYRGYWFGTTYFGANANPPVLPTNFGDYYNIDVLEHGGGTGGATLIYFTGGDVCPKGFSVPTAQQWINVTEGITGLTFTTPAKNINAELAAESTDAVAAMISSPLHLPLVGMSWRPDNNTAPTTVNQNKMAVYAVKDRAEQGTNGVFMPYIAFGLIQANIAASQPNLVASNNIKLLNHPTTGNQSGHAINFGVHVRCIRTTVAEPLPATQPEPKTANFNKNEMPAGW